MSKRRWIEICISLIVLFTSGMLLLGDNPFFSADQARAWMLGSGTALAALISAALLTGDILLPVPSSVLMTLNGQLFGLLGGSAVSFVGSMGAWTGCYWLGRLLGFGVSKAKGADQPDPVADGLRRYGVLLLIATRAVPLFGELIAASSGLARMNWWRFLAGSAVGTLPICVLYAWVGRRFADPSVSFVALAVAVLVPLGLYLLIARPWAAKPSPDPA